MFLGEFGVANDVLCLQYMARVMVFLMIKDLYFHFLLYYYFDYYLLSPLCRLFTITYLKQTMFLLYSVTAVLYLQFMVRVMLLPC